jgi:hypothetical protein
MVTVGGVMRMDAVPKNALISTRLTSGTRNPLHITIGMNVDIREVAVVAGCKKRASMFHKYK